MDLLENSITNIFRLCKFLCMAEYCICIFTKFVLQKYHIHREAVLLELLVSSLTICRYIILMPAGHVRFMTVIKLNKYNCVNNKSKAPESNEQMNIDTHTAIITSLNYILKSEQNFDVEI